MGEVYNITNGGDGMSGYRHNLEFRIKMSKKMKGRAFSEKTLKKMSLAKQNMSSETRLKIAKSKIGKIPWNKGGTHSETTRKKLSESHKGCIPWNKGGTHSDETKKKISISKIGFKPSRESVNRGRIKRIGQKRTEETKKKMSEARKLYYAKQNKATPDQILGITHATVIENMQKQTIRKKIK
jgi:hypothetical protein